MENWEKKADALLERMELDDKQNKLGGELSKGMQQKVSICCALLPAPKVVMLDEPLVGLDPHAIQELKQLPVSYTHLLVRIHVGLSSQRTFQSGGERLFGAFQIEVLVQIDFLCLCNRLVELRKVRAVNQGVQGAIQGFIGFVHFRLQAALDGFLRIGNSCL